MNQYLTKIMVLRPLLPAIVVAGVIGGSLAGYQAPVIEIQAAAATNRPAEQTTTTPPAQTAQPAAATTDSQNKDSEKKSKGNFDVKDGVYKGSGNGYGGRITVSVTVKDNTIKKIKIDDASKETPSFFNKAKAIVDTIIDEQSTDVDTISGATYSSRGIRSAVKNALTGEKDKNSTASNSSNSSTSGRTTSSTTGRGSRTITRVNDSGKTYRDGTYTGTGTGFGGQITVRVVVSGGKISNISVVSAPGETASYFSRAKTVLSKIVSSQSTNVDAVSGATYSSNGLITAVRSALSKAGGTSSNKNNNNKNKTDNKNNNNNNKKKPDKVDKVNEKNVQYKDGTYTGSADGFGGKIKVQVTVKNGKYTVKVIDHSGETPSYYNKAQGLVSTINKKQSTNVDAVSGATYSSNGIIKAVRAALDKAKTTSNKDDKSDKKEDSKKDDNKKDNSNKDNTKTDEITLKTGRFPYDDGICEGTGTGEKGSITVRICIQDKTLRAIFVTESNEKAATLKKAEKIIDTIIEKQSTSVAAISGAEKTSNGIKTAVKNALKAAKDASQTAYKNGTYTGSADGYGGKIKVQVTVKNGKYTVKVTDHSGETPSYYSRAEKLVGTINKKQSTDVDVVSGATYSSNGIIDAINDALSQASTKSTNELTIKTGKFPYDDGLYEGTGAGAKGPITVRICIQDKTLRAIFLTEHSESASSMKRAKKVIDTMLQKQITDIDSIPSVIGANKTSNGIKAALKKALENAAAGITFEDQKPDDSKTDPADDPAREDDKSDDGKTDLADDTTKEDDSGSDTQDDADTGTVYKDGTYPVTVTCKSDDPLWDDYALSMSVTIKGDKITAVSNLKASSSGNESFINRVQSIMVPKIVSAGSAEGVDVVSGSTCSSEAVREGCAKALEAAKK